MKLLTLILILICSFMFKLQESTDDVKRFQGSWIEYYEKFGMNCYTIKKNKKVVWYHEGIREKSSYKRGTYFIKGDTISLSFNKDTIFLVYKNGLLYNDEFMALKKLTRKRFQELKK